MEYRRFGNTIVARIDRGEEILAAVREIAGAEHIQLASVSALGATNDFTVGVYNVDESSTTPTILRGILRSSPSPAPSTPWTASSTPTCT